jgi:hypothetical protein
MPPFFSLVWAIAGFLVNSRRAVFSDLSDAGLRIRHSAVSATSAAKSTRCFAQAMLSMSAESKMHGHILSLSAIPRVPPLILIKR